MKLFNTIFLIFFLISSTNIFGMQRLKQIIGQLTTQQPLPETTLENIKLYPKFKNRFAQEIKKDLSKYVSNQILYDFLIIYPDLSRDFVEQVLKNLDQIDLKTLKLILQQNNIKNLNLKDLVNLYKADKDVIDFIYNSVSKIEQEEIVKNFIEQNDIKVGNILTVASIIEALPIAAKKIPKCVISNLMQNFHLTGKNTQTKHHIYSNFSEIHEMYNRDTDEIPDWINRHMSLENFKKLKLETFSKQEVKNFFKQIYKKEKEEYQKHNYVMFHARSKNIRFSAEVYRLLWNITKNTDVADNFIFMRFNQNDKVINKRQDLLFFNHALFGGSNEVNLASSISQYWMTNFSLWKEVAQKDTFSIESIFKDFNLERYYVKYQKEIKQLEKIHDCASPYGDIVLASIPVNKAHLLFPIAPGGKRCKVFWVYQDQSKNQLIQKNITHDSKKILKLLTTDPKSVKIFTCDLGKKRTWEIKSSNWIEWALPATKDYALDPINGPRFYSFYFIDEKSKKEYEDFRDQLFAKIKLDVEQNM